MAYVTTTMRLAKRLAVAALALCLYATLAHAAPKDVLGWQKVKWGTTPAQLEAAYGDQLKRKTAILGGKDYIIDQYKVLGFDFRVQFFWKNDKELSRVVVQYLFAYDLLRNRELFNAILQSMSAQYGAPKTITDEDTMTFKGGGVKIEYAWTFPSTIIQLVFNYTSFEETRRLGLEQMALDRERAEASGKDYKKQLLAAIFTWNTIDIDYSANESD